MRRAWSIWAHVQMFEGPDLYISAVDALSGQWISRIGACYQFEHAPGFTLELKKGVGLFIQVFYFQQSTKYRASDRGDFCKAGRVVI